MPLSSSRMTCAESVPAACRLAGHRPVGLRRDQRVSAQQVLLADLLVVALDVHAERRVGLSEPVLRGGQGHQAAVEVVPGAAEHAVGAVGPGLERRLAQPQVIGGLRDHERGADRLAGRGRGVGQHVAVGRVMLHVVQRGVGRDDVPEGGVAGDVAGHRLAHDVHVRAGLRQPVEELPSVTGCHDSATYPAVPAGATPCAPNLREAVLGGMLMPVKRGLARRRAVAATATYLLEPKNWIIATVVGVGWHYGGRGGLAWGLVAALFAAIVPTVFITRGVRSGRWDDRNVGARGPRLLVLGFILASVAVGLAGARGRRCPAPADLVLRVHAGQRGGAGGDHGRLEDLHPLRGRLGRGDAADAAVRAVGDAGVPARGGHRVVAGGTARPHRRAGGRRHDPGRGGRGGQLRAHALTGPAVTWPQPGGGVGARGGQQLAVGREHDGVHRAGVAGERG